MNNILTILTGMNNFQENYIKCGITAIPTEAIKIVTVIINLVQLLVPIILILMGSIDIINAVMANKEDEIKNKQKKFIKRLSSAFMVFMVITVVKITTGLIGDSSELSKCIECAVKGLNSCGEYVNKPFEFEYPEQKTIADPSLGFIQPPLRDDAYGGTDGNSGGSSSGSKDMKSLIEFAKKQAGLVYVWGGTSLSTGVDCSGFVQQVFSNFGVNLSRTTKTQVNEGTTVDGLSNAQPGDLLFFNWGTGSPQHVAIYLGNNEKIHASGDQNCRGKTANGCQVKIDSNSMNAISTIKRISLK